MIDLEQSIKELEKLNGTTFYLGVPRGDKFLNMVAIVNNSGKRIRAKNGKYLAIPTHAAGGKRPKEIAGLFQPKGKHILAVKDDSQNNGLKVMFILKETIRIPPRPFLRITLMDCQKKWVGKLTRYGDDIIFRGMTAREAIDRLKHEMVADMKEHIKALKFPENAPLTIERKRSDDPLIDKGTLLKSITCVVE